LERAPLRVWQIWRPPFKLEQQLCECAETSDRSAEQAAFYVGNMLTARYLTIRLEGSITGHLITRVQHFALGSGSPTSSPTFLARILVPFFEVRKAMSFRLIRIEAQG